MKTETKEVLQGELVVADESTPGDLSRSRASITPEVQTIVRERIADRENLHWSFSTLARRARIHAPTFIAAIHEAAKSETHELHEFALDIFEAWAIREETLMGKVYDAAEAKDRWEGFMTMLERQYSEDWRRPSQSAATQVVHIGVAEKVAMLQQNGAGELTTGD